MGLMDRRCELEIEAEKLTALLSNIPGAFWDRHQMIEDLVYKYGTGAHLMRNKCRARLYIPNETRFGLPARRGIDPKMELPGSVDSAALGDLADHIRSLESRSADDIDILHINYAIMKFWLASLWPENFSPCTEDDNDTADLWLSNAENAYYTVRHLHAHIPVASTAAYP